MWVKDETKDLSMVSRTVDAAVTTLHGIHVPTFGWVQRNFCYSQCKHKGILWKNYFQCTEKVDGYPLDFVIRGDVCPNGFYGQKKRSQSDQCTVAISNIAIFQNLDIFGVVSFHWVATEISEPHVFDISISELSRLISHFTFEIL